MTRWEVSVTRAAERDLRDAALYVRDVLGSPAGAARLVDEFESAVESLSLSPESRPLVRDVRLAALGYRWARAGGHIAFYTVDAAARTVTVERLLYGRADWAAIL